MLDTDAEKPSQMGTPGERVSGCRRANDGVAKLMEQEESSRAQEEITTKVKKRNADEAAGKRVIGPRAIAGCFTTFPGRDVGSSGLARVGISRDHDV